MRPGMITLKGSDRSITTHPEQIEALEAQKIKDSTQWVVRIWVDGMGGSATLGTYAGEKDAEEAVAGFQKQIEGAPTECRTLDFSQFHNMLEAMSGSIEHDALKVAIKYAEEIKAADLSKAAKVK